MVASWVVAGAGIADVGRVARIQAGSVGQAGAVYPVAPGRPGRALRCRPAGARAPTLGPPAWAPLSGWLIESECCTLGGLLDPTESETRHPHEQRIRSIRLIPLAPPVFRYGMDPGLRVRGQGLIWTEVGLGHAQCRRIS